jgi:hypothetical protein
MNALRKLSVLALAAAVVVTVVSLPAQGATTQLVTSWFSDVSGEQAQYLGFLGAINIFRGDSGYGGPCRPNGTLTRQEFAVIVVRMMGQESLANLLRDLTPPFSDAASIASWARGEVNVCYNTGIITGIDNPDGTVRFEPSSNVTGVQCVAMLTRAMQNDMGPTGVWPMNYMVWGYNSGLLPDAESGDWNLIQTNTPVTRAQMALLTYNALFLPRGFDPASTPAQWADPAFPYYKQIPFADEFVVYDQLNDYDLEGNSVSLDIEGDLVLDDRVLIHGATDLDGFLLRDVFVATRNDEVVYVSAQTPGNTIRGKFDQWVGPVPPEGYRYVKLEDGQQIRYTAGTTMLELNGGPLHACPVPLAPATDLTITVDGDGVATFIRAFREDFANCVVEDVNVFGSPAPSGAIGTTTVDGTTIDVFPETLITLNGVSVDLDDLDEFDIAYVATIDELGADAYAINAMRDQVSGRVDEVWKNFTGSGYDVLVNVEVRSGVFEELTMDETIEDDVFANAAEDENWFFNLNRDGLARYADEIPGPPPTTEVVKLTGFQDRAAPSLDRLTFDDHGTSRTFDTTIPYALIDDYIGYVCYVLIDDGVVTAFDPVDYIETWWEIVALNKAAHTMTVETKAGGTFQFFTEEDLAVYQWVDDLGNGWNIGNFIGWDGLSVGDWLVIDDESPHVFVLRLWNGDPEPDEAPGPKWL